MAILFVASAVLASELDLPGRHGMRSPSISSRVANSPPAGTDTSWSGSSGKGGRSVRPALVLVSSPAHLSSARPGIPSDRGRRWFPGGVPASGSAGLDGRLGDGDLVAAEGDDGGGHVQDVTQRLRPAERHGAGRAGSRPDIPAHPGPPRWHGAGADPPRGAGPRPVAGPGGGRGGAVAARSGPRRRTGPVGPEAVVCRSRRCSAWQSAVCGVRPPPRRSTTARARREPRGPDRWRSVPAGRRVSAGWPWRPDAPARTGG